MLSRSFVSARSILNASKRSANKVLVGNNMKLNNNNKIISSSSNSISTTSIISQKLNVVNRVNQFSTIQNQNQKQQQRFNYSENEAKPTMQSNGITYEFRSIVTLMIGGVAFTYYVFANNEEEQNIFAAENKNETTTTPQERRKRTRIIFVLGPPGAGKKTICDKIASTYDYTHLSVVELVRNEINNKTDLGNQITESAKKNNTFSAELIVQLLDQAISQNPDKKFVIEAFPRNDDTLFQWEKTLAHKSVLDLVLFLDVEDENALRERLLKRGNAADTWDNVSQRIEAFDNSVLPVAKYYFYMEQYPFSRVVTDNKSVDQVFYDVQSVMAKLKLGPEPAAPPAPEPAATHSKKTAAAHH